MGVRSLGQKDPLQEGMVTHSSILAWRIPWTEEPGRLWSVESQWVGHNWSNLASTHASESYLFLSLSLFPCDSKERFLSAWRISVGLNLSLSLLGSPFSCLCWKKKKKSNQYNGSHFRVGVKIRQEGKGSREYACICPLHKGLCCWSSIFRH